MNSSALPTPPSPRAFLLRPRVLDRIEQVVILLVFSLFAWRMLNAPNAYAPAVMVSETAVVLFTLIRRPTEAISLRLGDWLLATTSTLEPLLIIPNRGVKITGAYRVVRHPMYAGYLLVHIGVLAVMFSPYNLAVYAIGWTAQILRLLAEERLLGEDPTYRDYMAQVRWRLIPGVF